MKSEKVATRLKKIMNEQGLKQIDLINKCKPICDRYNKEYNFKLKITKSDLSQWLKGIYEPSQSKLTVLAEALNTTETWLMGYDVPKIKDERKKTAFDIIEKAFPNLKDPSVNYNLTHLSIIAPSEFRDNNIKINNADDIIYEKFAFEEALYSVALENELIKEHNKLTYEQIEIIQNFFNNNLDNLKGKVKKRKQENYNNIIQIKQKFIFNDNNIENITFERDGIKITIGKEGSITSDDLDEAMAFILEQKKKNKKGE